MHHVFEPEPRITLTRRDLQLKLRDKGRPWQLGNDFDQSAPVAPLSPASAIGHPTHGEGVGAVRRGQTMRGGIDGLGELRVKVV